MHKIESEPVLFTVGDLHTLLQKRAMDARARLRSWDVDDLLQTPDADVVAMLTSAFSAHSPALDRDAITSEPVEEGWATGQDGFIDVGQQFVAVRRFNVPFTGEPSLFHVWPNLHTQKNPRGLVTDLGGNRGEIRVALAHPQSRTVTADEVRAGLHRELALLEHTWLKRVAQLCDDHNNELSRLEGAVAAHKQAVLRERQLTADLGFPLRRRPDAADHSVPTNPQQLNIENSPAKTTPFSAEPTISEASYDEVLRILHNSRNALERSPSTTATLGEEQIRDLLLINLNAQFAGRAAGEVFNGAGKTDILVREGDRNVFIGECKIWHGPKAVTDAIDQLLSYLVWRDTKAALLLFIRTGAATDITAKAVAAIQAHPNCKRTLTTSQPERAERTDFVMHSPNDFRREIRLALMIFVLPADRDRP